MGGLKSSLEGKSGQVWSRPGQGRWELQGEGVARIAYSEILVFCSLLRDSGYYCVFMSS